MAGYNCSIKYLKGKDVCADLLSRAVNASESDDDQQVEIDDRNYEISAINSNLFEPKQFASYKDNDDPAVTRERPKMQGVDLIREQESDKDILELECRIKNGKATTIEQRKYIDYN